MTKSCDTYLLPSRRRRLCDEDVDGLSVILSVCLYVCLSVCLSVCSSMQKLYMDLYVIYVIL